MKMASNIRGCVDDGMASNEAITPDDGFWLGVARIHVIITCQRFPNDTIVCNHRPISNHDVGINCCVVTNPDVFPMIADGSTKTFLLCEFHL